MVKQTDSHQIVMELDVRFEDEYPISNTAV